MCVFHNGFGSRIGRVHEQGHDRRARQHLAQQLQPFRYKLGTQVRIAARSVEACDEAELDPVTRPTLKTTGIRFVAALAARVAAVAGCDDHGYPPTNQIGCQRRQPIGMALRPIKLNRWALALDMIGFVQSLPERCRKTGVRVRRSAARESNHWDRRLLPPRRQRPRRRRTTEQRDELPALHSITSSARASSEDGISRPSD